MGIKNAADARQQRLEQIAQGPCIVCGHTPAGTAGMWEPGNDDDRRLLGKYAKGFRTMGYALCEECRDKSPEILDVVERIIRYKIAQSN